MCDTASVPQSLDPCLNLCYSKVGAFPHSLSSVSFLFPCFCPQQLTTFQIYDKCLNISLCLFLVFFLLACGSHPDVCVFSPNDSSESIENIHSRKTLPTSFTFYQEMPTTHQASGISVHYSCRKKVSTTLQMRTWVGSFSP